MKIVAKVPGENRGLLERLQAIAGVTAKLVKGAVIAELPRKRELVGDYRDVYLVPPELRQAELRIDCEESGGGATNTGSGTVVCGVDGEPLTPYYIPRGGSLCNATHAYFSVPEAVVTATGYRHDQNVTIVLHRIVRLTQGGMARIETRTIWSGEINELPETFAQFQAAAEAAHRKGNCYHCRCVHFSAGEPGIYLHGARKHQAMNLLLDLTGRW